MSGRAAHQTLPSSPTIIQDANTNDSSPLQRSHGASPLYSLHGFFFAQIRDTQAVDFEDCVFDATLRSLPTPIRKIGHDHYLYVTVISGSSSTLSSAISTS